MKNVSFEEAVLEYPTFSNNCDLSSVKLPKTGNYKFFDFWEKRLEHLYSKANQWSKNEQKEAEIFAKVRLVHAKKSNDLYNECQYSFKRIW